MGCAASKPDEPEVPELTTNKPDATEAAAKPVAAPSAPQATVDKPTADKPITVDKATYVAWEREVIKAFYTPEHKVTALFPTDEQPAVLSKEKYILVVDACDAEGGCISEKVGSGATEGLPEHQHVQLWHFSKEKEDGVRFGHAVDDGIFKHPACDLGGLTNLRQEMGKPVKFAGTPVPWGAGTGDAAETVAESLLVQWRELTGKELTPTLTPQDITKFLGTVEKATTLGPVMLRFHLLPPEHRVVVTPTAVKKATGGIYYARIYGGGDKHAKIWDGEGEFFCGVTEKFVTTNLNKSNLEMECVTYA